jgi:hypothetical protein
MGNAASSAGAATHAFAPPTPQAEATVPGSDAAFPSVCQSRKRHKALRVYL